MSSIKYATILSRYYSFIKNLVEITGSHSDLTTAGHHRLQIQLELLMMSGMPLKTC